jgi:arylformamidase
MMNQNVNAMTDALKNLKVYNISPIFESNMPGSPGNPPFWTVHDARTYDMYNFYCQTLIMGEHIGAHIDAPAHTTRGGKTIDEFEGGYFIAPYKLLDCRVFGMKAGDMVTPDMIKELTKKEGITIEPGDIILFCYGWDKYYRPELPEGPERKFYGLNSPGLSDECCLYLMDLGVKAIGSDTCQGTIPMADGKFVTVESHDSLLLPHGIAIIEGLINLGEIPTEGLFIALPLKIKDGSGSPVTPIVLA